LIVGARGGGEVVFAHERYRVSRDGGFVLEGPDGVVATARAAGGRCFEIAYAGRRLAIGAAPGPRRAYLRGSRCVISDARPRALRSRAVGPVARA
jgi:hypothetical protein